MQDVIKTYLKQVKIGRKQSYKNLTVFPVLSTYSLDLDYLLLDEALSEEVIEVIEVEKEGTVHELKAINKSPRMILILDGEELVGQESSLAQLSRHVQVRLDDPTQRCRRQPRCPTGGGDQQGYAPTLFW